MKHWRWLLFIWTCIVRGPTFLRSAIESDEGLYLLIARDWAHGIVPYTGVWDHKPVGTYVILRALYWSDASALFSLRFAAILFVFIAAVVIGQLAVWLHGSPAAGPVCAFLYPVLSLLLGGTASNTEHFFIAFTLVGLFCLTRAAETTTSRSSLAWLASAGLSFGAAFQVKYVVAVEVIYLAVSYSWVQRVRGTSVPKLGWLVLLLGTALPTCAAFIYFAIAGAWQPFIQATLMANLRHAGGHSREDLNLLVQTGRRYVTSTLWFWTLLGLAKLVSHANPPLDGNAARRHRVERWLFGWLLVCFVEASLTGKFYVHYLLPSLVPLALLAGSLLDRLHLHRLSARLLPVAAVLVMVQPLYATTQKEFQPWIRDYLRAHGDPIAVLARRIEENLRERHTLFVLKGEPIIYLLTNTRAPTRFVFPPFLLDPHFSTVASVDYVSEFHAILRKRPECILIDDIDQKHYRRASECRSLLGDSYQIQSLAPATDLYCLR